MKMTSRNCLFPFLLTSLALFLAGCSSIMRPPPAAAYMDSYKRDNVVTSASISFFAGQLDNDSTEQSTYSHTSHAEWWGDGTFARYISGGYFTFGWGIETFTPFLQAGFVSPYIGLTGWSSTYSLFYAPLVEKDEKKALANYAGGGMLIEQIPLNDKWKIGFTQHISRNGRELYYVDEDCFGEIGCGWPSARPKFYTEVGGGFYVSRTINDNSKMSLEFRYGRDLDEKRNRVAITLDFWGFSSPIPVGGNDVMRKIANKNIEKMKSMNTASANNLQEASQSIGSQNTDSLHTIKRQWIRIADSSQTLSNIYKPADSVLAVTTKGICYDENANAVWLKQDYGNMLYQVSADSMDYCQLMERKNLLGSMLLIGASFFPAGGLLTGSLAGGLAIGSVAGIGFWAIMNFAANQEELAPKVYPGICSEKHTHEQIINWLKQYPCGGKIKNDE
jgi:hypothetical protein